MRAAPSLGGRTAHRKLGLARRRSSQADWLTEYKRMRMRAFGTVEPERRRAPAAPVGSRGPANRIEPWDYPAFFLLTAIVPAAAMAAAKITVTASDNANDGSPASGWS